MNVARLATGTANANTVLLGNGTWGPLPSVTSIDASAITSGVINTARLGSGTANANTVLLGSGVWGIFSSGASLTKDETNTQPQYISMSRSTSGSYTSAYVSANLYFTPSTGTLNATIYNSLSDQSQKSNIIKIINACNTINHIDGFEYDINGIKSSGVVAQNIETILPHLVSTDQTTNLKSVNYSGLTGYFIEAIKELQETINKQNIKINELESKINLL